jgi:hypothetical protein
VVSLAGQSRCKMAGSRLTCDGGSI